MPSSVTIAAPPLAASRQQARDLFSALAADLSLEVVHLEAAALKAAAPSFVDELVRVALVDRRASRLVLEAASPRLAELADRFANNHAVRDRLDVSAA